MKETETQHYHVCVVLKWITRGVLLLAIENRIDDKTRPIFEEIGVLLNRILVINQTSSELISMKVENFTGIEDHVKGRYDIDDVWKKTDELIDSERKFDPDKLTSIYLKLHDLFNEISKIREHPIIDIMADYCLNGLYLGYMMEKEIERLYGNKKPELPRDRKEYYENTRRVTFFKNLIGFCTERLEKSKELLCLKEYL